MEPLHTTIASEAKPSVGLSFLTGDMNFYFIMKCIKSTVSLSINRFKYRMSDIKRLKCVIYGSRVIKTYC